MGLCFDLGAVLEGYPDVLFAVDGDVVHHRQPVCFPELRQRLPATQVLQVGFDLVLSGHALGNQVGDFGVSSLGLIEPDHQSVVAFLVFVLIEGDMSVFFDALLDEFGKKPLGEFVREIVGLDMAAAKAAFNEYLKDVNLDYKQNYFVNQIVEYIVHNGLMKDLSVLQELPFTDLGSIVEIFADLSVWAKIKSAIDSVNSSALAAKSVLKDLICGLLL